MELELRLTILAIGLVIIVLIYLWGIRHRLQETWEERQRRRQNRAQNEPVIEPKYADTIDEDFAATSSTPITPLGGETSMPKGDVVDHDIQADHDIHEHNHNQTIQPESEEYYDTSEDNPPNMLLFIVAPKDKPYQGADIVTAMQALDLKLNAKGTWSFHESAETLDNPVFRVGHLKEPGIFDIQTINTLTTPGLVLFMQLPGPLDALTGVDRMIGIAGQLSEKLGGSVCDDHRHKMTPQLISHLRAQATEYDRRLRLRS